MDMLDGLLTGLGTLVKTADDLNNVYDKRFKAGQFVGAIVFDQLRVNDAELRRKISTARSTNQRLCYILDSFQNVIFTLKIFMESASRETKRTETEILKVLGDVIGYLNYILHFISKMRSKLNDFTVPVPLFPDQAGVESQMTESVKIYLHESSITKLVYAVRNYAIVTEILICADSMATYLHQLQTAV